MIITHKILQQLINEEFERAVEARRAKRVKDLDEGRASLNEDMFDLSALGAPKKIGGAQPSPKWRKVKADAKMALDAIQKVLDAALDSDEEQAAKWIQKAGQFTKSAYSSLLES